MKRPWNGENVAWSKEAATASERIEAGLLGLLRDLLNNSSPVRILLAAHPRLPLRFPVQVAACVHILLDFCD